eukprot:CAMPEP_0175782158 /NCGR_PEP_ID=MMETSP0097-20121207/77635_1 /TAXON_ID=311494 /ORGANISM="Alexandrium monilatum, Strain CCMP3105" /LENGTH=133 /DNA_ID=CAMNT_0017092963 /DNA_START=63 /DNA_END=460 /DNA_ORIENTATION=+
MPAASLRPRAPAASRKRRAVARGLGASARMDGPDKLAKAAAPPPRKGSAEGQRQEDPFVAPRSGATRWLLVGGAVLAASASLALALRGRPQLDETRALLDAAAGSLGELVRAAKEHLASGAAPLATHCLLVVP